MDTHTEMLESNNLSSPMVIEHEIRLYGLRRTGNHAIINWILSQAEGTTEFLNDTLPEDPYNGVAARYSGKPLSEPIHNIAISLISFEDRSLHILRHYDKRKAPGKKREIKRRTDILVMRDAFNLFASRMKSSSISHTRPDYHSGQTLPQITIDYLDAFTKKESPVRPSSKTLFVNFNRWNKDKNYRKALAENLGIRFTDSGLNKVSSFGGGSSFDGNEPQARELNLENRWKTFADNREYIRLFRNTRLLTLTNQVFGPFDDDVTAWLNTSVLPETRRSIQWIDQIHNTLLPPLWTMLRSIGAIRWSYRKLNKFTAKSMLSRRS